MLRREVLALLAALAVSSACAPLAEPVAAAPQRAPTPPEPVVDAQAPPVPVFVLPPVVTTLKVSPDATAASRRGTPGERGAAITRENPTRLTHLGEWATYMNGVHNRIHPFFAEGYLGKELGPLDKSDPLSNPKLFTRVQIIIDRDGQLLAVGTVKSSGIVAFDVAVLDSVTRAGPFSPPPPEIRSPDGSVYFLWEFHRETGIACSTLNARPLPHGPPAAAP